jgi:hypothetical protein
MHAIAFGCIQVKTEASPSVEPRKLCREQEFRSALASYIAGYADDQKGRAGEPRRSSFGALLHLAIDWVGGWFATLCAIIDRFGRTQSELGVSAWGKAKSAARLPGWQLAQAHAARRESRR